MRYKLFALILVNFLFLNIAFSQDSSSIKFSYKILPDEHIVPLYTADSRAHRLSIQKPTDSRGYIGSMGGIFPLASLTKFDKIFQFSVAASSYLTLNRWTNRGQVVNVDFFVDIFLDFKIDENFSLRSGGGHTSQHLSDDALLAGMIPINYVRDYYQLFVNYKSNNTRFFTYGGLIYNHNFKTNIDYSGKSMLQFGFEHSPVKFYKNNYLYYAYDVKFREEFNFSTTNNLQIGLKYATPQKRTCRLAFNYFSGLSEIGQTYQLKNDFKTVGLYFDF